MHRFGIPLLLHGRQSSFQERGKVLKKINWINILYTLVIWTNVGIGLAILIPRQDVYRWFGIAPILIGIFMVVLRTRKAYKEIKEREKRKHE
jgi:uncharacterized membrane protein YfcA